MGTKRQMKMKTIFFIGMFAGIGFLLSSCGGGGGGSDTADTAPTAVTLSSPTNATQSSLQLTWTQNTDSDFASHKVYYSTSAGVTETTGSLGYTSTGQTSTGTAVTNLRADTTYYFKVYTCGTGGLCTGSNEVSGSTTAATVDKFTSVGSLDTNNAISTFKSGNYLYVADGYYLSSSETHGMLVVDVSIPSSPSTVGIYSTTGADQATSVFVSENYAYLSMQSDSQSLRIIDISNPASPTLAGSIDEGTQGGDEVFVSGNYAYFAGWGLGLRIIDVSNPASPSDTGLWDDDYSLRRVFVSGNYAYVLGDSKMHIIDISNPASPGTTGSVTLPGTMSGIYVSANYAYVAAGSEGLKIIDISTPSAPFVAGTYSTATAAKDVYVSGNYANYAYVIDSSLGLLMVDVTTPAAPELVSSLDFRSGYDIKVESNTAYVAAQRQGIRIIGITP